MKNAALSVVCLLLVLTSVAVAQDRTPVAGLDESVVTGVAFTPEARVDISASLSREAALVPAVCTPNATTYCANNSRFQVRVIFSAPSLGITNAPAQAISLTDDTGYFWFFSSNNVEIVIKVVDGRAFNGFFWVFEGALTDVEYTITVTDTQTGAVRSYHNSAGHIGSFADTAAFVGGPSCTYTLSPSGPQSFGASGGTGSFSVLTQAGCSWTAVSNAGFITITGGSSGTGNGVVTYSVAANSSTSLRSGNITAGGQTYIVNQSGTSAGGSYDGSWTGTTNQTCASPSPAHPCPVSFNVANNQVTSFSITFPLTGNCFQGGLGVTFNTPLAISGNTFTFNTSSGGNSLNVNTTLTSNTTASGTTSYTFSQVTPVACSGSGSASWTASR
jgi:hypothetical protein